MNNKNGSKPMSYKQEYYIKNLLTYKVVTENYHGYVSYVLKLLQDKAKMTTKQASCIIDTLKRMIEIENVKDKGNNNNENSKEIEEETIE